MKIADTAPPSRKLGLRNVKLKEGSDSRHFSGSPPLPLPQVWSKGLSPTLLALTRPLEVWQRDGVHSCLAL